MHIPVWLDEMWVALQQAWYPEDPFRPDMPYVKEYYMAKARIAYNLQPTSICEFGSRAGYSLFAMAYGLGEYVQLTSYDVNVLGLSWQESHANIILSRYHHRHYNTDLQTVEVLDRSYDLIHVDADHSYKECLHDTWLALRYGKYVLVDDYHVDTIEANEIRLAANHAATRAGRRLIEIPDPLRGQALIY